MKNSKDANPPGNYSAAFPFYVHLLTPYQALPTSAHVGVSLCRSHFSNGVALDCA